MPKYVCLNNPNHVYDEMTLDGFCIVPECYGKGFLVEIDPDPTPNIVDPLDPVPNPSPCPVIEKKIGFYTLLMDASPSMNEKAFQYSPALKKNLVATSAAEGIFDLKDMSNKEDAYICIIMFSTNAKVVFMDTVANIFKKFSSSGEFADFLKSQFNEVNGRTDINNVLSLAKEIYDDFVDSGDLSKYGGPSNVKPDYDPVVDKDNNKVLVPNARVMIYTDGMDTESSQIKNPFKDSEVDVLMGAYFGDGEERGCSALREILSKCPKHDFEQFFLINDPRRIQTLRFLFRMASGPSGFCPICLANPSSSKDLGLESVIEAA